MGEYIIARPLQWDPFSLRVTKAATTQPLKHHNASQIFPFYITSQSDTDGISSSNDIVMYGRQHGYDKKSGYEATTWTEALIQTPWYEYVSRKVKKATPNDVKDKGMLPARDNGEVLSLFHLARHSVLNNIERYNEETFKNCEPRIGLMLWADLCQYGLDSFRIFRAFVHAFPSEVANGDFRTNFGQIMIHKQKKSSLPSSRMRVREQTILWEPDRLLNSETLRVLDSSRWLVFLSMDSGSALYGYTDLLALAEISTLVALDLSRRELRNQKGASALPPVNERIIRAWGRKAEEEGKLSRLKILVLRRQHELSTDVEGVLAGLYKLSALEFVDMSECEGIQSVLKTRILQKMGWKQVQAVEPSNAERSGYALPAVYGSVSEGASSWPMDLPSVYSQLFNTGNKGSSSDLCVYGKLCDQKAYVTAGGLYDKIQFSVTARESSNVMWLKRCQSALPEAKYSTKRSTVESGDAANRPSKSARVIKDKRANEIRASFDSLLGL